jgi:hypothetical protein
VLRAWVVSFLIVAVAVGATLWYLDRNDGNEREQQPRPPAAPRQVLDAESIEAYIRIQSEIDRVLARAIADGSISTPEGGEANRAEIHGLLQKHGYSAGSWDRVRRRVENAVVTMRAQKNRPERLAEIDREISVKEAALDGASDSVREQLEKDIAMLRALKESKVALHEADIALLERYWTDLDRIAPRVR